MHVSNSTAIGRLTDFLCKLRSPFIILWSSSWEPTSIPFCLFILERILAVLSDRQERSWDEIENRGLGFWRE